MKFSRDKHRWPPASALQERTGQPQSSEVTAASRLFSVPSPHPCAFPYPHTHFRPETWTAYTVVSLQEPPKVSVSLSNSRPRLMACLPPREGMNF